MKDQSPDVEADGPSSSELHLPEELRARVNRDVLAARTELIHERFRQRGAGSVFRRRYIEVIANHLLKTLRYG